VSGVSQAILRVMEDLARVGLSKDRTNQQQHFAYRGVDDLMNVLAPLLVKHKLLILPRVQERTVVERESRQGGAIFSVVLKVDYEFLCVDDDSHRLVGPFYGEAMDSGDKATNKATSVAYKYACIQTFCIPTEGDDPDATVHEVVATVTPPPVKSVGWDGSRKVGFSKNYRDFAWRDIPQDFLDWCNGTGNRLNPAQRDFAMLEQRRRNEAMGQLPDDLPDSFYAGTAGSR
jgi:ERF superfamily